MGNEVKLYMIMLGCRPKGRCTEQHDIFFGIGSSLKELIPSMNAFWPEAKGQIHIDAWREVTTVDNEFEEYHYKMLAVGDSLSNVTKKAKDTAFYKHCGFKGATSHIDDKFGIDIDDAFKVREILLPIFTDQFEIQITPNANAVEDQLHIGYLKMDKIL